MSQVRSLAVLAGLILASCGQASAPLASPTGSLSPSVTAASPSASPTTSPSASNGVLFGVLESGPATGPDTVAIVGLDGIARAKATFKPMPIPVLGCGEGGYITHPAVPAGGSMFYLSSDGVVRRLSAGAPPTEAVHLPVITDQQTDWFAVSPDGSQLIATIVAFPPLAPSSSCVVHQPGSIKIELVSARVGSTPTVLQSQQQGGADKSPPTNIQAIMHWDTRGPIASDPPWQAIGSPSGQRWGETAVRVDAAGNAGAQLGGTGCNASYGSVASGAIACYDMLQPIVKDAGGTVLWKLKALAQTDNLAYGNVELSPDASHVAFSLYDVSFNFNSTVIRGRDGTRIGLSQPFVPEGWLDNSTVIGTAGTMKVQCSGCSPDFVPGNMAIVRLAQPNTLVDLGFAGSFVGVVQPAS